MDRLIKLEPSPKRKKILLLNDLLAAVLLLLPGLEALSTGKTNVLALASILTGSLQLVFCLRELRSLEIPRDSRILWYDLVSAIVIVVNAWMMYKPWKGFQPAYLYLAVAVLMVLKSFSVIKPAGLFRRLKITDKGFMLRTGPFSTARFNWDEVLSIDVSDHVLHVTTPQGQKQISMKSIDRTDEVGAVLREALNERA